MPRNLWDTAKVVLRGNFIAIQSHLKKQEKSQINNQPWDLPGGTVVKNLPANVGDTGLSPGPGRSHMPRSNSARVPQLLSLHSRACEPQLLSPHATTTEAHMPQLLKPVHLDPVLHNKRSHCKEKPTHCNDTCRN